MYPNPEKNSHDSLQGGTGLKKASILIVENEPVIAIGMKKILTEMGYSICGVTSTGEMAVEKAGELHPDIILMDIELDGDMTGIDAAEKIRTSYRIPVIYLTAYGGDQYIEKAKITEPFGYILKPVRVGELRTTIEIALYKHAMEQKLNEISPDSATPRTIFLKKALSGITLILYKRDVNRFSLFKHVLEEGISDNIECLYAFYHTNLISYFSRPIASEDLRTFELREGTGLFDLWFDRICASPARSGSQKKLFCVADVSNLKNPDVLLHIKKKFSEADQIPGMIFSGILAVPLDEIDSSLRGEVYDGVHHFVVLSGEENIVSFSPPAHQQPSVNVVSQEIMDSVVKKSLEVLILSCLQHPVTGFDIIRDINERFHVAIPLARVYTYLYELEKNGILTTTLRGNLRIYSPTKEGGVYIKGRLSEINTAYEQVLGTQR